MKISVEHGYFEDVEYEQSDAQKAISDKIKTVDLHTIEGTESDLIEFLNMFYEKDEPKRKTFEELSKDWGDIIILKD